MKTRITFLSYIHVGHHRVGNLCLHVHVYIHCTCIFCNIHVYVCIASPFTLLCGYFFFSRGAPLAQRQPKDVHRNQEQTNVSHQSLLL